MPPAKPSRQEILRQQQQFLFVGREAQLAQFDDNLKLPPDRWCFLFNIWGQGGVGKSTLLRQFRQLAEGARFIAASINEAETTVAKVMGRLAEQFEQQGYALPQFGDRYKLYCQKQQEIEADPEAPQGFSAFLGKTVAKASLGLAKQIPGGGAITPLIDEDAFTTQASEWAMYVAKKLSNKDEVKLVQDPIAVLTPLFLQDLNAIADQTHLLLLFDTYERTGEFLDSWLRDILAGQHGDLSTSVILAIAGRDELDPNVWSAYDGAIARFPLNPFTVDEATQYLHRKGINHPSVIETILRLSDCLPLLVTTLAAQAPTDPTEIGDVSDTAIDRFLKWVDDPKRRQIALDGALPRSLNRDIIALLHSEKTTAELFAWLITQPFVEPHNDGYRYHDVVRTQMLRHKRRTSPQNWASLHDKLAEYYEQLRSGLQLEEAQQWSDATWQTASLHVLYHRLCQSPQANLPMGLNGFLAALKSRFQFARQWAETITQAGDANDNSIVQQWGEQLHQGLIAYDEERYEVTIQLFTNLLNQKTIESQGRSVALNWRGRVYNRSKQKSQAVNDLTQALQLAPEEAEYWIERGWLYCRMQRYEEALIDLNHAIELDPNYKGAIAVRGRTYRLMQRYEEALIDLNRAIELTPSFRWAIARRGETYRSMERYKEALMDLNRAIELDPNYAWAIASRGETYLLLREGSKALEDFNRAIELKSQNDWYLYSRALTYFVLNQPQSAQSDLQQAIQLAQQQYDEDSQDHRNTFNLALYYLMLGNWEQAKHFYRDALNRGASQRRIRVAIEDLAIVLRLFPNHQLARSAKAVLEKRVTPIRD